MNRQPKNKPLAWKVMQQDIQRIFETYQNLDEAVMAPEEVRQGQFWKGVHWARPNRRTIPDEFAQVAILSLAGPVEKKIDPNGVSYNFEMILASRAISIDAYKKILDAYLFGPQTPMEARKRAPIVLSLGCTKQKVEYLLQLYPTDRVQESTIAERIIRRVLCGLSTKREHTSISQAIYIFKAMGPHMFRRSAHGCYGKFFERLFQSGIGYEEPGRALFDEAITMGSINTMDALCGLILDLEFCSAEERDPVEVYQIIEHLVDSFARLPGEKTKFTVIRSVELAIEKFPTIRALMPRFIPIVRHHIKHRSRDTISAYQRAYTVEMYCHILSHMIRNCPTEIDDKAWTMIFADLAYEHNRSVAFMVADPLQRQDKIGAVEDLGKWIYTGGNYRTSAIRSTLQHAASNPSLSPLLMGLHLDRRWGEFAGEEPVDDALRRYVYTYSYPSTAQEEVDPWGLTLSNRGDYIPHL